MLRYVHCANGEKTPTSSFIPTPAKLTSILPRTFPLPTHALYYQNVRRINSAWFQIIQPIKWTKITPVALRAPQTHEKNLSQIPSNRHKFSMRQHCRHNSAACGLTLCFSYLNQPGNSWLLRHKKIQGLLRIWLVLIWASVLSPATPSPSTVTNYSCTWNRDEGKHVILSPVQKRWHFTRNILSLTFHYLWFQVINSGLSRIRISFQHPTF